MAWEIVEELMIGSTKYTWNFPSELKNIILSEIEYQGNPNFSVEITSQIPNHSMHDWTIVDYPFTFHKGSDGNWQGGASYTIGLGTYSIPSRDYDGVYYELTNGHRAGVNYISNTNGTKVVFFAINETAHQAAIMYLMSAWYLSADMNRISLTGSGTNVTDYEQFYSDLLSAIPSNYTSNGGGATHIAKRTGQLKDLSSYTSDILIVSGGGGGGLIVGETAYSGKEAGGISGSGDNSADQSTGNAFGLGESGTGVSGGGSGLYGGYKGTSSKSGGAGSGYIGNSLLSNKKMVGYNVPTSSAEGTKTESVNDVSASAVSGNPKSGNGFARIKFLNPLYTLLTATYVDDKIAESKWGDKVRYAEWANLQSGGRMTCSFDGQNNFIGFNDSSPSYSGYHDAMNMIQPFSKGNYKYLIFKTDVVFEYSSEYEGLIVVRDDYIANSSTKIGTLWTSPIQKTVPYNQESTVIIDISSLNDTIYIYLITHKVKRFKIKEMYLG